MSEALRILILEDNPADAELIQFELEEGGLNFNAKIVISGKDFINSLQEFCPDLILSDYDLPNYNGCLALTESLRRCPETPFILVTGAVSEDRAIEILTQGAKDYVLKARLQQRLIPAVRRALVEAEEHKARKKAEEDLRKAHKDLEAIIKKKTVEFNAVLDTAPIAIWIAHDPECKLITGNAYADEVIMKTSRLENFSFSSPSNKVVSFKMFHNGIELKPEEMPAQIVTATGASLTEMELKLVFPDGRHVHLIVSGKPIFDTNGCLSGAVLAGSDVSRLKHAEEALRQSEERQRLILQASSLGTFELDLLTGEALWNDAEYELFGLIPGSRRIDSETFFSFVHPDDLEMVKDTWEDAKRTGKLEVEFRIIRADGQVRWLEGKGQFLSAGKPKWHDVERRKRSLRFMGVNFDITKRKQAEDALRKSEHLYRAIGESINYGIWVSSPRGRNIYASKSFLDLVGLTQEQFSRLGWRDVLHPDDVESTFAAWNECVSTGKICDIEHRFCGVDGQSHSILTLGTPVKNELGKIIYWAGINLDISKLKNVETALTERTQQLGDANKELESFSYSISHDLKAPLRIIDGYCRMILGKYSNTLDNDAERMIKVIKETTERMNTLINDLLDFSKVTRESLKITCIDMNSLAREAWDDIKAAYKEREIEVRIAELLPGYGDRHLIKQVLVNLFSNAVKFTKLRKPAIIELTCYKDADKVVFCLRDNGVGFDMNYYDKLFGVFQRLHDDKVYEGTGVGLALVQRIIHKHGGEVWAESQIEKGSNFCFSLPDKKAYLFSQSTS